MKKLLFALLAGSIPALVATNGAFAQNTVRAAAMEPQIHKSITGNETTVAPVNNSQLAETDIIGHKALKNFTKTYKGVYGESWEKIIDGYSAMFTSNGVQTRTYFDTRGNWNGSLKGYGENKMDRNIRDMVKREYYDYAITYVQEVETSESNGIPTYVIHLEDSSSFKLVRIYDGQMSVWKEYKKQS